MRRFFIGAGALISGSSAAIALTSAAVKIEAIIGSLRIMGSLSIGLRNP
jgi:hypothetical protein